MDEDKILDAITKLERKVDNSGRSLVMVQQDVREIRSLMSEIAEVGPDVEANRQHLLKLERQQGRFDLRLVEVERKIAGMGA
jgi:hypothetical protein